MEDLESINRNKKYVFLVRVMYLLALGLIFSGVIVNTIKTHESIPVGQEQDSDYNNDDVSSNPGPDDESLGKTAQDVNAEIVDHDDLRSLSLDQIDKAINGIAPKYRIAFESINNILNLGNNLKNKTPYVVQENGQSLSSILQDLLDKEYPGVKLQQQDLTFLFNKNSDLKHLLKGQEFQANFNKEGQIVYLSWKENPKYTYRYIRIAFGIGPDSMANPYAEEKTVKGSERKNDTLTFTAGRDPVKTLADEGLSQFNAGKAVSVLLWELNGSPAADSDKKYTVSISPNAKFTVLATREYVGNQLVSTNLKQVFAIKLVQDGKTYYTVHYGNNWFNEKGLSKSQITFLRYPLTFKPIITSPFNPHRLNPVTHRYAPHNGVDFGIPRGTTIVAPADGTVIKVASQPRGAGNYLVVKHDSVYTTVYMHLTRALVQVGQKVKQGQRIALSGNTGRSTGPHLHYEVHVNGRPENPMTVQLPMNKTPRVDGNPDFQVRSKRYISLLDLGVTHGVLDSKPKPAKASSKASSKAPASSSDAKGSQKAK